MKFDILELDQDHCVTKLPINSNYENEIGTLHGGVYMALADYTTGYCANFDADRSATTIDASLSFINPYFGGDYVIGRAYCEKRGRKTIYLTCKIEDEKGKTLCISKFTYYVFDKKIEDETRWKN